MKHLFLKLVLLILTIMTLKAQNDHGIDLEYMDTTVRPQDNFYDYTNGTWMKTSEIPADRSRWGSFDELRQYTDSVSLGILQKGMKANTNKGDDMQKVTDLYVSFMDWKSRNNLGISPLQKIFSEIDKINNTQDLQQYFTTYTPVGGDDLYGFYVSPNMKNSKMNSLYLSGPNLGMGRDYYQKEDDNSKQALSQYVDFLSKLQQMTAIKTNVTPQQMLDFEKELAGYLKTVEEARDSKKRYNPMTVQQLDDMVKNVDFRTYFREFNISVDSVIIPEIKYYQNLDKIINNKNIPMIKAYLKYSAANSLAGSLNQELDELNFDFYGKTLNGQKEQRPLDQRALQVVNGSLGEVLGKLYVAEVFPPEAKDNAKMMVSYLLKAFKTHIQNLQWMSEETKVKAQDKLAKFTVKIGYPDKWKDYSKLEIESIDDGYAYFDNVKNIGIWRFYDNLSELDKPVDKSKWGMSPQTVNAYYNPLNNEIVFPAAILQPPFYDFKADMAINFGGIGAVIGHEISHGFDDSGAQYNGDGNLENWWTPSDLEKFKAAGQALAKQYSSYEPLPGVFVNGEFTLGENIADLGGVSVAFDALQMYLNDNGQPGKIQGYTPEQRFYLSWATIWRSKYRDAAIKNQVKTDPHSPGLYRAFGPLVNQEDFDKAFQVKQGDKMYKADKIIIW